MEIRQSYPLLVIIAACCTAPAAVAAPPYTQHQNVVYAEVHGIALVMDVFTPAANPNGLAIVDVVSGAYHSGRDKIRDHMLAQTFSIFCERGYTVFAIRPGSITKFSVQEMLENLERGILWIKQHAPEHGIDPDRLGLMGASAGGHLASLAAVTADPSRPPKKNTSVKAAAVFFPPTDFVVFNGTTVDARSDGLWGQMIRRLAFPQGVGNLSDEELRQKMIQISPARLVTPQAPPFLLIHGDADPIVPLQQSEVMLEALKKAGVSAELIVKAGGGHPWLTLHEEVRKTADWFDKQLKE